MKDTHKHVPFATSSAAAGIIALRHFLVSLNGVLREDLLFVMCMCTCYLHKGKLNDECHLGDSHRRQDQLAFTSPSTGEATGKTTRW